MSFGPREYLRHVLTETEFLVSSSAELTRDEFMSSEILRRAFVRSLEVIGEASKKVPTEYKAPIHTWNGARWPACAID